MTDEKLAEATKMVDEMLSNPLLAPHITTLPTGEQAMTLGVVKTLLLEILRQTDEAMQQVVEMIKNA